MFNLYNSYSKKVEPLNIKNNIVNIYVCGPTVYNYIHIGNARPLVVFDTLIRALNFCGYDVKHVSNITDVDDKIIIKAQEEKVSEKELTDKFLKAYNQDVEKLNILSPHNQPGVVDNMKSIINLIKQMVDNKSAYITDDGDVYFNISKSSKYGILANTQQSQNIQNASNRLDNKKESSNFVLWKTKTQGINFDSPWGKGRPGWHTECVALIHKNFSTEEITIHGGGIDLKFPHHTNEIAQSEAVANNKLATHWIHNGFVQIEDEKMSKSKGNTILLRDCLQEWDYKVIKLLFLSTHYQKPVNFNQHELRQLSKVSQKIDKVLSEIKKLNITGKEKNLPHTNKVIQFLKENLNTSNALSELYLTIKNFNKANDKSIFANEILNITKILGLR